MAGISLRSYQRDIERLIEGGRTEEAIAHCRYILQYFPRNVEVYRLMGKAYLERQNFTEAADVLQRVLSAVPEDFVSHVGMSMVREDEGNLDEAIGHMERAFEIQPANGAIQDELRRLFERRDGVQPPKVRLNRGALARMYARGDLNQQAIAEGRAALAEDPARLDLQALLAEVYLKTGQRNDAIEAANIVLRRLPFCLQANRVMARALSSSDEHKTQVQAFQERIQSLDPYSAHVSSSYPTPESVPDTVITLEKLTYRAGQAAAAASQPSWASSLGVNLAAGAAAKESLPDWLSGVSAEAAASPATSSPPPFEQIQQAPSEATPEPLFPAGVQTAAGSEEEPIPDWMKTAGWGPASGGFDEAAFNASQAEASEAPTADGSLASADIPDWLKAMAPQEQPAPETEQDAAPWLDSIFGEQPASARPAQPVASAPNGDESGLPDWLAAGAAGAAGIAAANEIEDWLDESGAAQAEPGAPTSGSALASAGLSPSDFPEWLMESSTPQAQQAAPAPVPAVGAGDVPDWLADLSLEGTQANTGDAESAGWLSALKASPAEAGQTAEAPIQEMPDWLTEAEERPGSIDADYLEQRSDGEGAPEGELPDWLLNGESAPGGLAEAPAAGKTENDWLAGLSTYEPDKESDQSGLPDWLAGAGAAAGGVIAGAALAGGAALAAAAGEEAQPQPEAPEAIPAAELPDWLTGMNETPAGAAQAALEEEALPAEDLPDWLTGMIEEAPAGAGQAAEEATPVIEGLPDWLLATGAIAAGAALADQAEPPAEIPPVEEDETLAAAELPDWLTGMTEETPAEAAQAAVEEEAVPAEDLPDWLTGMIEETPAGAVQAAEEATPVIEGLPDWLLATGAIAAGAALADQAETPAETPPVEEEEALAAAELPDWLTGMTEETPAEAGQAAVEEEAVPAEGLPDWLLATGAIAAGAALADQAETPAEIPPVEEEEALAAAELPDWLTGIEEETPAEAAQAALEEEAVPAEGLPDWLVTAGAIAVGDVLSPGDGEDVPTLSEQEAFELADTRPTRVAPVSTPAAPAAEPERIEAEEGIPLDWLIELPEDQIEAAAGQEPAESPAAPEAQQAATPEQPAPPAEPAAMPALDDADAAFAWLESLAVKQGATEALLLGPEERQEKPPEWVETAALSAAAAVVVKAAADKGQDEIPPEQAAETVARDHAGTAAAQPAAMPALDDADAAFAWLESLAVKQGATEALLLSPEERQETPPEWIEKAALEAAPGELQEETPLQPTGEKPPAAAEAEAAGPAPLDSADADFAWLESLAVRQGADEALLLKPEERSETPPAWVLNAQQSPETEPDGAPLESTIPSLEETLADAPELFKAPAAESALPAEPAQTTEIPPAPEIPPLPAAISAAAAASSEALPDLPSWLAGAGEAAEEMEWTPPVVPQRTYDLNKASLGELERLPGVGFIMAQRIIAYRDANGPFYAVEDLLNVSGFTTGTLEGIQERLVITATRPAAAPASAGSIGYSIAQAAPPELNEARDALGLGEVTQAIEKYAALVEADQYLEYVVQDLEEMVERRPDDIDLWQTLGDAYLHSDQVAKALEAYTKAERLLR